jgi:hypothetical protein
LWWLQMTGQRHPLAILDPRREPTVSLNRN